MTDTRFKLVNAVTSYDRRQQARHQKNPRFYYNIWALPQYLQGVDNLLEELEAGQTLRKAITNQFSGRMLDACLKAVGETTSTLAEQ